MLAAHIDSLLFILLVGAAALMRLLAKKAGGPPVEDDEVPPPRTEDPPTLPRQESQTDEERIRKFLEALGQPTSSQPPPPVRPRVVPPPIPESQGKSFQGTIRAGRRRNVLNPLPPLTTAPAPEKARRVTFPRQMTEPASATTPIFEVQQTAAAVPPSLPGPALSDAYVVAAPSTSVTDPRSNLNAFLKNPDALRQAIILREIFGPPRSLQPLDLPGNA